MKDKELASVLTENRKMRKALEFIHRWEIPKVESQGEMVSFECAYGSNGARDYMRGVASTALHSEINIA